MVPILAAIAAPFLKDLAESGLSLLSGAIKAKGKQVIEDKLGVDIESAMQTEEGRLKLLQLQTDHEEFLVNTNIEEQKLQIKREEMAYADTASARNMQVAALNQSDVFAKRFVYWLAAAILLFGAFYITALTFVPIPVANQRFADASSGFIMATMIAAVVNFFFGTTAQSKSKDDTIRSLTKAE